MKKRTSKIFVLFAILVLSVSFVSAGFFNDVWGKITGEYVITDEGTDAGCVDYDGSLPPPGDYNTASSACMGEDCAYDYCSDELTLKEATCISIGRSWKTYTCPGKCENGACVEAADKTYYYFDADDDGYGTSDSKFLTSPEGNYRATKKGDCDDSDPNVHPGAEDICDGIDNNCDGEIDEHCCVGGKRDGKIGQQIGERCDPVNIIDLTGGVYPPCCSGNCVRPDGSTCINHNDCICVEATEESDAAYVEEEWVGDEGTTPATTIPSDCLGTDTSCGSAGACIDCTTIEPIKFCNGWPFYDAIEDNFICQNSQCVRNTVKSEDCPKVRYACYDERYLEKWTAKNPCIGGECDTSSGCPAGVSCVDYNWPLSWAKPRDCGKISPGTTEYRCRSRKLQERTHDGKGCADGKCYNGGWSSWESSDSTAYRCCAPKNSGCVLTSACCDDLVCHEFKCQDCKEEGEPCGLLCSVNTCCSGEKRGPWWNLRCDE